MIPDLSLFVLADAGSAAVSLLVAAVCLRERPDPLATPLAMLMIAVAVWAVPDAIGLASPSIDGLVFWTKVSYLGGVVAPVTYLLFALRYAGHEEWLRPRTYALLLVVPTATILVLWTNPAHGVFWRSTTLATVGDASVLVPEYGPWYWVNLMYLYGVTLTGLGVLGKVAVRSSPIYRKQASILLLGGLVPLAVNVLMNMDVGPQPMVDLTTTALAVTGVTFALALFRFDLLDVRPVARDRLFDELDDGVVVIGPNGTIRDYNATAERVLGDLAIDEPADDRLPTGTLTDGGEIVVDANGTTRRFRTRSTGLTDHRGEDVGRIVYLNDVTDIVQHERRIGVLNRILRHNIRNELNVAAGQVETVATDLESERANRLAVAREHIESVNELANQARYVEETIEQADSSVQVSTLDVLTETVDAAAERFPEATIDLSTPAEDPPDTTVEAVDDRLLRMAFAELLENAVVHNDAEVPRVTVTVDRETADSVVRIHVADNGPGIPRSEVDVVERGYETDLQHTSGLGLWLVHWVVRESDGTIRFSTPSSGGTLVTVELPTAT